MRIWRGYGSEHSMNLVMIGRFRDSISATHTHEIITNLTAQVNDDIDNNLIEIGTLTDRFTDTMFQLLRELRVHSLQPSELEQFAYDASIDIKGDELIITTDEIDVSAFIKVMLDKGARVELYSAHDYSDTGYGR